MNNVWRGKKGSMRGRRQQRPVNNTSSPKVKEKCVLRVQPPHSTMFADLLAPSEVVRARPSDKSSESRGRTAFGTVLKRCASPIGANLQKRCRHCQRTHFRKKIIIQSPQRCKKRRPTLPALSDLDAENTINRRSESIFFILNKTTRAERVQLLHLISQKSLKDVDSVSGRDTCVVLPARTFEQNSAA